MCTHDMCMSPCKTHMLVYYTITLSLFYIVFFYWKLEKKKEETASECGFQGSSSKFSSWKEVERPLISSFYPTGPLPQVLLVRVAYRQVTVEVEDQVEHVGSVV